MKKPITTDDTVEDLLAQYPEANRFLMRRGILCVQCGETFWGTLGELMHAKGIETEQIIAELNQFLADRQKPA